MRIVGGEFRGRALKGPSTQAVRPTSDRLRESLFNILAHNYPDALEGVRVIDLFAGTGALGLEAISRGARFGLFVDRCLGAPARPPRCEPPLCHPPPPVQRCCCAEGRLGHEGGH